MRSELVFEAKRNLPSGYELCRVLSTAARKFHRPGRRVEDTTDDVLRYIADSVQAAAISGKSSHEEL